MNYYETCVSSLARQKIQNEIDVLVLIRVHFIVIENWPRNRTEEREEEEEEEIHFYLSGIITCEGSFESRLSIFILDVNNKNGFKIHV